MDLTTQAAIDNAGGQIRAFFVGFQGSLVTGWSIQVQQAIPVYDAVTGTLLREVVQTTQPGVVNGTATATSYSGGTGAVVTWTTGSIFNGRRIKGRTFLVPLVGVNATDGTLSAGIINTITTMGNTLISGSAEFALWAKQWDRPEPPHNQVNGTVVPVTGLSVPDRTGILKSRRD